MPYDPTMFGGRPHDAEWLRQAALPGPNEENLDSLEGLEEASMIVYGQDSTESGYTARGDTFYAGYINGYVSYPGMVGRHPGAHNWSITIRPGVYQCDVIDVEPGCCSIGEVPAFMERSTHPHSAKPILYNSSWQSQSFINYLASHGIARNRYFLWSAHVGRGVHICAPHTCGYAQADATQYLFTTHIDYDIAYASMFGPAPKPVPTNYPVSEGATGPLVKAAQEGLNKWHPRTGGKILDPVDSDFGPATKAQTAVAQKYFYQRGVAAGEMTQWLMDQLAFPLWPISTGRQGLDVENLQNRLNAWSGTLGFALLDKDGAFGSTTANAVNKAQVHWGQRGVTAGQCTQSLWEKLEGNP